MIALAGVLWLLCAAGTLEAADVWIQPDDAARRSLAALALLVWPLLAGAMLVELLGTLARLAFQAALARRQRTDGNRLR